MIPRWQPMRRLARGSATVLLILGMSASALLAQRTDDEWLASCREQRGDRVTHCLVKVDRVQAGAPLSVDASPNGGITVLGADRSDVEIHARIQAWAGSAADAESLAAQVRLDYRTGSVRSGGPDRTGRREGWSVSFVLYVPRESDLVLRTQNGPVSAADVAGTIEARTQNGPLSLTAIAGDVNARTQNGPITVQLDGARWQGAGLDAETQNGPISLHVPEGFNARLEAGTRNGRFNTELPLQVLLQGRTRANRVEATLGEGGPLIRAMTTNGPVNILRSQRAPAPMD